MGRFHATLISGKLVETVNFYEDHFGFVATLEQDGYVVLQNQTDPDLCVAVFDANHPCVDTVAPVQGLILNLGVANAKAFYDHLYMEGLEMFKDLGTDILGQKHFIVRDPNGVLINVFENQKELLPA